MDRNRVILSEKEIPEAWYNLVADLSVPVPPPLNPKTKQPIDENFKSKIIPPELIRQGFSKERWIEIPSQVREVYRMWRPSPLTRALRLERALKTPARIYFKDESVSPTGSFKPNTAVPQAYYSKTAGKERLVTETGAGQWGSALAFASIIFDIKCTVYMVKVSYDQKPYRRIAMQTWGANVHSSPSDKTEFGKEVLKLDPNTSGSLGIAASEAIEDAFSNEGVSYAQASVTNPVILHQSIIGLETKKQFEMISDYPDIMIGCVGGGSNFTGLISPFVQEKLRGREIEFIGCEAKACPSLTRGVYAYDNSDTAGRASLLKMYTVGHTFIPPGIHAGGLRYHGAAPILSVLNHQKVVTPRAYYQNEIFEAAVLFARNEGILPAPESAHAIKGAIEEAIKCRETGQEKCIVFGLSGNGHFDLSAYDAYSAGKLQDYEVTEEKIKKSLNALPLIDEGDNGIFTIAN